MISMLRRLVARLLGRDCWLCGDLAPEPGEVCAECAELDLNWRRYREDHRRF